MLRLKLNELNIPPKAFGYSFWWAWLFLAFFPGLAFFPKAPMSLNPYSFLVGVLTFAVVLLLLKPETRLRTSTKAQVFTVAISVAGTFLVAYAQDMGSLSQAALAVGMCLTGVGSVLIQLLWGELYSTLNWKHVTISVLGCFLIALVMAFFFSDRGDAGVIVTAFLPVLAVWFARSDSEDAVLETEPAESKSKKPPVSPLFLAFCVVYGFVYGIMGTLYMPALSSDSEVMLGAFIGANVVLVGVLLLAACAFPSTFNAKTLYQVILPVVTLGILLCSLSDSTGATVSWAIVLAGLRCGDMVIWVVLVNVARCGQCNPLFAFCWGCGGVQLGILLATLADALLGTQIRDNMQLVTILLFILVLLVLGLTMLQGKGEAGSMRESLFAPKEESPEVQLSESPLVGLAQKAGLSPREMDVFELLCKGRSATYIAEQLCIAPSTANTHVHNIYRKMGVHNRQELLDRIVDGAC